MATSAPAVAKSAYGMAIAGSAPLMYCSCCEVSRTFVVNPPGKVIGTAFNPKLSRPIREKLIEFARVVSKEKKANVLSFWIGPPNVAPAWVRVSPGSGSPANALVAETFRLRKYPKTSPRH
jgi:hypothetical protein